MLVVRLSNPHAEGLNNANRVENEVASQYLVRQSLEKDNRPLVVPAVYAWGPCRFDEHPDETGFGWSILEFKQGSDLDALFPTLSREAQISVIEQIADSFLSIQRTRLPESVTHFGALTFNESGQIVTGQMPLVVGGPWDTYTSLWTAKLKAQLLDSDKSSLLRGWKYDGIRERLENFLASGGVSRILGTEDISERVLIHGDLSTYPLKVVQPIPCSWPLIASLYCSNEQHAIRQGAGETHRNSRFRLGMRHESMR